MALASILFVYREMTKMGLAIMQQVWDTNDDWDNQDVSPIRVRLETVAALLVWVVFGLGLLYITPTMIAVSRDTRATTAIALMNLALGWTGIGWVLALVWANLARPVAD